MQVLELEGAPANLTALSVAQPIFSQAPSPYPPLSIDDVKLQH